ncbi:MAG: hypothetical protein L6V93_12860 [Clostridiales bacterium]|nr:MAG: hypothetical protein L6V93_12860 [Clostridiales bacterium]
MNTSGEVADFMAKEAIQLTESAVKLTALGVKNLAAIVMALANDDGKTEGVAKIKANAENGQAALYYANKRKPTFKKIQC